MVEYPLIRTTITIEKQLLNKVKIEAINQNKTQTEVIIEYIIQGLKKANSQEKLEI